MKTEYTHNFYMRWENNSFDWFYCNYLLHFGGLKARYACMCTIYTLHRRVLASRRGHHCISSIWVRYMQTFIYYLININLNPDFKMTYGPRKSRPWCLLTPCLLYKRLLKLGH